MVKAFTSAADAAFALLLAYRSEKTVLTRKAGAFTGATLVDSTALSDKQEAWMQALLAKAGLPPLHIEKPRMTCASPHVVIISHEPFGAGYDVVVTPAVTGQSNDREFPDLVGALNYARDLRSAYGWLVRDLTGESGE